MTRAGEQHSPAERKGAIGDPRTIVASLLAGLFGGLLGAWAIASDHPSARGGDPGIAPGDATARVEALERTIEQEVRARSDLSLQVARLDARVSEILALLTKASNGGRIPTKGDETPGKESMEESGIDGNTAETIESTPTGGFDDELLLSRGMDSSEVARLREIWEEHELERAEIADRALREGWFLKERHRDELARLDQALREDLQDVEYDRYLYAQGKPNRLRARDVLKGGAAAAAGLRPGDIILRYGDTRVFTPGELLLATSRSEPGRRIPVQVQRNGAERTLYVEPGPLGVMIEPTRGDPLDE